MEILFLVIAITLLLILKIRIAKRIKFAVCDAAGFLSYSRNLKKLHRLINLTPLLVLNSPIELPAPLSNYILYVKKIAWFSRITKGDLLWAGKTLSILYSTLSLIVLYFISNTLFNLHYSKDPSFGDGIWSIINSPSLWVVLLTGLHPNFFIISVTVFSDMVFIFFLLLSFYLLLIFSFWNPYLICFAIGALCGIGFLIRNQGISLILSILISLFLLKGINGETFALQAITISGFVLSYICLIYGGVSTERSPFVELRDSIRIKKSPSPKKKRNGFLNELPFFLKGFFVAFNPKKHDSLFTAIGPLLYISILGVFVCLLRGDWQAVVFPLIYIFVNIAAVSLQRLRKEEHYYLFCERQTFTLIPIFALFSGFLLDSFRTDPIGNILVLLFLSTLLLKYVKKDLGFLSEDQLKISSGMLFHPFKEGTTQKDLLEYILRTNKEGNRWVGYVGLLRYLHYRIENLMGVILQHFIDTPFIRRLIQILGITHLIITPNDIFYDRKPLFFKVPAGWKDKPNLSHLRKYIKNPPKGAPRVIGFDQKNKEVVIAYRAHTEEGTRVVKETLNLAVFLDKISRYIPHGEKEKDKLQLVREFGNLRNRYIIYKAV